MTNSWDTVRSATPNLKTPITGGMFSRKIANETVNCRHGNTTLDRKRKKKLPDGGMLAKVGVVPNVRATMIRKIISFMLLKTLCHPWRNGLTHGTWTSAAAQTVERSGAVKNSVGSSSLPRLKSPMRWVEKFKGSALFLLTFRSLSCLTALTCVLEKP